MFFSYSAQRMQSLTKTAFITKMDNKKGLLLTSQPKWNPIQKSVLYLMRIKGNILLWRAGTWLNCSCANRNKTFSQKRKLAGGFALYNNAHLHIASPIQQMILSKRVKKILFVWIWNYVQIWKNFERFYDKRNFAWKACPNVCSFIAKQ